jgi:hypothetical protein
MAAVLAVEVAGVTEVGVGPEAVIQAVLQQAPVEAAAADLAPVVVVVTVVAAALEQAQVMQA